MAGSDHEYGQVRQPTTEESEIPMKQIVLLVTIALFAGPGGADEIRLATQPKGHRLSVESRPYVECALKAMGRAYTIEQVPWKRAQRETEAGAYDGFFIATRNDKRDVYAVFSSPFYAIKWLYVVKVHSALSPDLPNFKTSRFGADLGSARLAWLQRQKAAGEITGGVMGVNSPDQVLKMLLSGRIEVGLLNDHGLTQSLARLCLDPGRFRTFWVHDTPAGVYFSKSFLKKNLGFMEGFDRAIDTCKTHRDEWPFPQKPPLQP